MPEGVARTVARIGENCEPALTSILFMAGAGGSLRAGVTDNPILLTRGVQGGEVRVTMGGAPCMLWPGGGITLMADVLRIPTTPSATCRPPPSWRPSSSPCAPISTRASAVHVEHAIALAALLRAWRGGAGPPWQQTLAGRAADDLAAAPPRPAADGRLHLSDGPIDLIIGSRAARPPSRRARRRRPLERAAAGAGAE
jgi:hypothetical protein